MSRPDFENIDLWLFEYSEGNLSPEQVEQLRFFVFLHPELEIELDAWESAKVDATPIEYPHFDKLYKQPRLTAIPLTATLTALALLLLFVIPVKTEKWTSNKGDVSRNSADMIAELTAQVESLKQENRELKANNQALRNSSASTSDAISFRPERTDLTVTSISGRTNSVTRAMNSSERRNETNTSGASLVSNELNSVFSAEMDLVTNDAELELIPVEPIDYSSEDQSITASELSNRSFSSSGYKKSFGSKIRSFGRTIQRMMDNPVALKNSRDPHFIVPNKMPQDINFSTVGTLLTTRVQTLSRAQWLGTDQEQFMNSVCIDGYSFAMRGGIGLQMSHSTFHNGGIQQGEMAMTYAPKISVNRFLSIEPSLRFKMGTKILDFDRVSNLDRVEFEPGIDHEFYPNEQTPIGKQLWYKDLGAGLMVNTKWFFAGVNLDNMFRHQDKIYTAEWDGQRRSSMNFTATIGTDWENAKENMRLSPYVVFNQYEGRSKLFAGANYQWSWFMIGAGISNQKEPMASIGIKTKFVSIHYVADYSKSNTLNNYSLSHQVSLRINGKTSRFGKRLTNL